MKVFYSTIKNSDGSPAEVTLSPTENFHLEETKAAYSRWRKITNALGYEIDITTLTTIVKKITEQKFFEVAPADYLPVRVGEGAWSSDLVTYRTFDDADDGSSGLINMGSNNSRLAEVSAGVDSLRIPVLNWAKTNTWSLMDLQFAAKSGNWDIVTAKEKARKRNYDLFVQRVAFLGIGDGSGTQGLLNQNLNSQVGGDIKIDTTTLTNSITSLSGTPQNLSNFLAKVLQVYRNNCGSSAMPTHFIIPQSDYLGLATATSASFPLKSILQYMQETFQTMTNNKNFKILPCAYADGAAISTGLGQGTNQTYVLLNYAEESLRMDIPVDYTNTMQNSINSFQFQNVGYGQLTGVLAYRPREMYYFQFPSSNLS